MHCFNAAVLQCFYVGVQVQGQAPNHPLANVEGEVSFNSNRHDHYSEEPRAVPGQARRSCRRNTALSTHKLHLTVQDCSI